MDAIDFRRFEYRKVRLDVRSNTDRAIVAFAIRDGWTIDPDTESARWQALGVDERADRDPICVVTFVRARVDGFTAHLGVGAVSASAGAESEPVPAEAVASLIRWREALDQEWFQRRHGQPTAEPTPEERALGISHGLRQARIEDVPSEHWHTLTYFKLLTRDEQIQLVLSVPAEAVFAVAVGTGDVGWNTDEPGPAKPDPAL
jgi:hypothetical protein